MVILKYRKRKRYLNLVLAFLWVFILALRLYIKKQIEELDIWIICFAVFFTIYFVYLSKKPLLTLSKTRVIRHHLLGKKIILTKDLIEFEVNSKGDYVLKSKSGKNIYFNPVYLDRKSLKIFETYLSNLISERS